jgi:hypothetical protein
MRLTVRRLNQTETAGISSEAPQTAPGGLRRASGTREFESHPLRQLERTGFDPQADDRERALPKSSSFHFPVYEVEHRMCQTPRVRLTNRRRRGWTR